MKYFSIIILVLTIGVGHAQSNFSFIRLDSDQGLSDNSVLSIHQDKKGFIWIGSMNGLNRHDGYNFKNVDKETKGTNGLLNQRIANIQEDNYGHLWLTSFDGMFQRFNPEKQKITHYPKDIGYNLKGFNNRLLINGDGSIVMAFMGIGVFFIDRNDSVKSYPFDENIINKPTHINFILNSKSTEKVLIGTKSNLLSIPINSKIGNTNSITSLSSSFGDEINFFEYCETDSSIVFATSDDGLYILSKETMQFTRLLKIDGISLIGINQIQKDHKDQIWISTSDNGIIGIRKNKKVIHIKDYNNIQIGNVLNLKIDRSGMIWFHSDQLQGLFKYNPVSSQIKFYSVDFSQSVLANLRKYIQYFFEDSNNNLWIGTVADGLLYYDRKKDSLLCFKNDPSNIKSISSNGQLSIFEDQSGTLWLGTRKGGINKINLNVKDFFSLQPNKNPIDRFHNEVDAVYSDDDKLWVGTFEGRLYTYSTTQLKNPKIFSHDDYKNVEQGFKKAWFYCFLKHSDGTMWAGSKGQGLFKILQNNTKRENGARFENYVLCPINEKSIKIDNVYDMVEDYFGRIWLATYGGGLNIINKIEQSTEIIHYNKILAPDASERLIMGRCVLNDKSGRIWYGGLGGIYTFKVGKDPSKPFDVKFYGYDPDKEVTLSYNDIKTIYEDEIGTIWIGTYGGGLDKYDEKKDQFINFSEKDGLPSNIIYGIIQDRDGFLWLSTQNGLSRFDPELEIFTNYFVNDGLLANTFSEAKPSMGKNGELYFGTTDGIVHFLPENIKKDNYTPKILFSEFEVSNNNLTSVEKIFDSNEANNNGKIILKHNQNNFSIEYASTAYFLPEKNKFSYYLENYETDFNYVGSQRKAVYTNLAPGKYIFHIKATNNDGVWSDHLKSLDIIIKPPLWKTDLAYTLYALLLFVSIYFTIKIIRKINQLKNSLVVEKEINKIKLQFFTNISHEFRTPLTLIINPIKELLEDRSLQTSGIQLAKLANKNASQLLHLINEILDFRKVQNKMMQLKITENEYYPFFKTIVENFDYTAKKHEIMYTFSTHLEQTKGWFDIEKIEKILTNLISNAFKFTPAGGEIRVIVTSTDKEMTISVNDTGIGLDLQSKSKLFTRFYQEKEQIFELNEGTGIGLSLVKELTELHKGKIKITSQPEKGSQFQVKIPTEKASYTEDEIVGHRNWIIGSNTELINQESSDFEPWKHQDQDKDKLLIVEDEPELLYYLSNRLSNTYIIETAKNGEEGYYKAQKFQPDIIVTDLMMPIMDGDKMTQKIKNSFETSHIPIIMLTAKTNTEEKIEGYTSGADAYIEKPFDLNYLKVRINSIISQRKMLKERFKNDISIKLNDIGKNNKDAVFLEKVEAFINDHMESPEFSVEQLYSELGYSKTLFFNKIKSLTGYSPNNFIKTIRLRKSAELLLKKEYSISEISNMVGYNDINYFRKQFKSFFNRTPSEYSKLGMKSL